MIAKIYVHISINEKVYKWNKNKKKKERKFSLYTHKYVILFIFLKHLQVFFIYVIGM